MNNQRRDFIKNMTLAAASLPTFGKWNTKEFNSYSRIELESYATNWGFRGSMDDFASKAKAIGYDGIEVWTPQNPTATAALKDAIAKYDLKLGLLAGNWGSSFEENLDRFKTSIDKATELNPLFINCHSGKDFYSFEQNSRFIEYTLNVSAKTGIPIAHETHRGRILYSAPIASYFMDKYEDLKLTLDISHWCCVHESLLTDQKETVARALDRSMHVHARVGFPEGPQIPDPKDKQFERAVKAHFEWWDVIVENHVQAGKKLTMTPEFGPPPYMWTHLESGDAVADNWEVNSGMKSIWASRYMNSK